MSREKNSFEQQFPKFHVEGDQAILDIASGTDATGFELPDQSPHWLTMRRACLILAMEWGWVFRFTSGRLCLQISEEGGSYECFISVPIEAHGRNPQ